MLDSILYDPDIQIERVNEKRIIDSLVLNPNPIIRKVFRDSSGTKGFLLQKNRQTGQMDTLQRWEIRPGKELRPPGSVKKLL